MLGRSASVAIALAQDAFTRGGTLRVVLPMEPNSLAPHRTPSRHMWMVGLATLSFAPAILSAAGLSFLGLGAQPPTPEWGAMVSDRRDYQRAAW
jgi:peptide/nickel transport system permease protein